MLRKFVTLAASSSSSQSKLLSFFHLTSSSTPLPSKRTRVRLLCACSSESCTEDKLWHELFIKSICSPSSTLPLSYLISGFSSPVKGNLRNGSQRFVAAYFPCWEESFDRNSGRKDFSYRHEHLAHPVYQSHARRGRKDGEKCPHNRNFATNFEAIVSSYSTRFRFRWCYSSLEIASYSAAPQIS